MMFIPWKLIAVLVSWVVVATFVYEHEQEEFTKERAVAQAVADKQVALTNQVAQILGSKVGELQTNLVKAQADGKAKDAKIQSIVAANHYELRSSAASCSATPSDSAPASGDTAQPSAQLSGAAGDLIFDIARTGNQAIIALNACIQQYDEVKTQFDKLREPQ